MDLSHADKPVGSSTHIIVVLTTTLHLRRFSWSVQYLQRSAHLGVRCRVWFVGVEKIVASCDCETLLRNDVVSSRRLAAMVANTNLEHAALQPY